MEKYALVVTGMLGSLYPTGPIVSFLEQKGYVTETYHLPLLGLFPEKQTTEIFSYAIEHLKKRYNIEEFDVIITHSRGGIILENYKKQHKNRIAEKTIYIAPPYEGSELAYTSKLFIGRFLKRTIYELTPVARKEINNRVHAHLESIELGEYFANMGYINPSPVDYGEEIVIWGTADPWLLGRSVNKEDAKIIKVRETHLTPLLHPEKVLKGLV